MKSESRSNLAALSAALVIGCFITYALLSLAWNSELRDEEEQFSSLMVSVNESVSQRISAAVEQVYALSMFFNASNYVDADEFSLYSQDFLNRHTFVQSASYAPLVEKDLRGTFEKRVAAESNAPFTITEKRDGSVRVARERDVYLPVQHYESLKAPSTWEYGADLLNEPALSVSIQQAFETGHAIAVPYNQGGKTGSYLLLKALYADKGRAFGEGAQEKTVTGLLVLYIDAAEMLESIHFDDHLEINLSLVMDADSQSTTTLATLQGEALTAEDSWQIKWQQSNRRITGQSQTMILSVRRPIHWDHLDHVVLLGAGLTGIVITVLLLITTRSLLSRSHELRQRNEQIQKVVEQRTQQLDDEKKALEAEIVERERIETESMRLGKILDDSDNEIYVFDAVSLLFLKVNKGARRNLGYSMDELRQLTPVDIKPEFSEAAFNRYIEPLASGEKSQLIFETVHERKDGTTYPVEVRLQLSSMGTSAAYIAIIQDISERKARELELLESEQRYRASAEHAPEAILVLDLEKGSFVDANKKAEELFGYERADLFKLGPTDVSAPIQLNGETADKSACQYIQEAEKGGAPVFEWLHRNSSGDHIPCEIRLVRLPSTGHTLIRGSVTDISKRKQAQAQMSKLSRALERTGDAVIITDRYGVIEYVNPAFEEMSGFTSQEALGKTPNIIKSGKHDAEYYKQLWSTLLSGEDFRDIMINRMKDGTIYYEEKTISPLQDANKEITNFVATGKNITERMQFQEKLHYLAHHDVLTNLPNRAMFVDRLTQALLHARRHGRALSVMFLDMDRFKVINDTLGHDIGDMLLQEFGKRLVECVRSSDTVARLGGDEFIILLEDMADKGDASTVADKVINVLTTPFVLNGRELFMTTSIGISVFPGDGDDVASMLKNADTAMYRAKEQGRNNYQFYSADMSNKALERLAMETQLRWALDRNEFVLYYQPKLDYRSGKIVGAEALIRWVHPEQGLVSPAEFIPMLEETGLVVPVGEWVLKTACAQHKAWKDAGLTGICMSVNLSARQLEQAGLLQSVQDVIEDFDLKPGDLELELTESIIMNNAEKTIEILNSISRLGVGFSVDDFGTGYSSLAYLKRFPIQTIKIDRAFVKDITTDPDDESIVKAIIAMSRSLKLEIIAEGVESEAQAIFLQQYGCNYMQGFLFSKPVPAAEFAALLEKENSSKEQEAELV